MPGRGAIHLVSFIFPLSCYRITGANEFVLFDDEPPVIGCRPGVIA